MRAETPQPCIVVEALHDLKKNIMAAWDQLPSEHKATMALVLFGSVMEGEWGPWVREAADTLWSIPNSLLSLTEEGNREDTEILDPRHFYAAYIFDRAKTREDDVRSVIEGAQKLDYPVRYWWLSDAMNLEGTPDRLIVCINHPSRAEDAGMDLYESLSEQQVSWDDLEAAALEEYHCLGNPVSELGDLCSPHGNRLFPHAVNEEGHSPHPEDALLMITPELVREELEERLGRDVTDEELTALLVYLRKVLDHRDWTSYLDEALNMSVEARQKRWDEQSKLDTQSTTHKIIHNCKSTFPTRFDIPSSVFIQSEYVRNRVGDGHPRGNDQ